MSDQFTPGPWTYGVPPDGYSIPNLEIVEGSSMTTKTLWQVLESAYLINTEKRDIGAWSDELTTDWEAIAQAVVDAYLKSAWIPCGETLPENTGTRYKVFAICTKKIESQDLDSPYFGQGILGVYQDWIVRNWPDNFTYWMPMPLPPAAEVKP